MPDFTPCTLKMGEDPATFFAKVTGNGYNDMISSTLTRIVFSRICTSASRRSVYTHTSETSSCR